MLTAQGAAKAKHHICSTVKKLAKIAKSLFAPKIEVDAHVHASLTVMAIERARVAILCHQRANAAQIISQLLRRNGSILPPFPPIRLARNEHHSSQRRLAHVPHTCSFCRRAYMRNRRVAPALAIAS